MTFFVSGTPISLFNLYRLQEGLSNADLGIVSLGYFIAAASALLIFGRISNHTGRKPLLYTAIVCLLTSCALLLMMHSVSVLLLARILQGFACGIASSNIAAYLVDVSEQQPGWLVALITSCSPMLGISGGAISSGALATWGPAPRSLIYMLLMVILSSILVTTWFAQESIKPKGGWLLSLRPRLYLPEGKNKTFLTTAGVVIATWSLGAFYQAFGPSVLAQKLNQSSAFMSAIAFSSVMILTPLGGYISRYYRPHIAIRLGMGAFIVASFTILISLKQGWLISFIGASLLVGLSQGVATAACLHLLLHGITSEHRAGTLATVFVTSYSGAVFPGAIASAFAHNLSVFQLCMGYVGLGFVAATFAIIMSAKLE
nr:MFS transporter [Neptunicella marina]